MPGVNLARQDKADLFHGLSYLAVNSGCTLALVVLCLWHWLFPSGEKAIQFVPVVVGLRLIYSIVGLIRRRTEPRLARIPAAASVENGEESAV